MGNKETPIDISSISFFEKKDSIQKNPIKILEEYQVASIDTYGFLASELIESLSKNSKENFAIKPLPPINMVLSMGVCKKQELVANNSLEIEETVSKKGPQKNTVSDTFRISPLNEQSNIETPKKELSKTKDLPSSKPQKEIISEITPKSSTDVEFKLTILPVRFVYVNDLNEIIKIWNNVKENDSLYVLKFFKEDEKTEISENPLLKRKYLEVMKGLDAFKKGVIYSQEGITPRGNYAQRMKVDFSNSSTGTEEVYTYI